MTEEDNNNGVHAGMSDAQCSECDGTGLDRLERPCACVARNVTRACIRHWQHLSETAFSGKAISLETCAARPRGKAHSGLLRVNWLADFELIAKRALADKPGAWAALRKYALEGYPWQDCCAPGTPRTAFLNRIRRAQVVIGHAILACKPYSVFPISEYMNGTTTDGPVKPFSVAVARVNGTVPLRPPLRKPEPRRKPAPVIEMPAPAPAPAPAPPVPVSDSAAALATLIRSVWQSRGWHHIKPALAKAGVRPPEGASSWTDTVIRQFLFQHPVPRRNGRGNTYTRKRAA